MVLNFLVSTVVSSTTAPPPKSVQRLVEEIRIPRGAGPAHEIRA
jgi:cation/acetate symporter